MDQRPFKFLDSYTREDAGIFFGREKEVEELHTKVFESRLLLVYGVSGSGKSSLVNCGLSSKFEATDWLPINIRRRSNITQDIIAAASGYCTTPPTGKLSLRKVLRSVYLDQFMPVYLIVDQLEELFIFGEQEEIDTFIDELAKVLSADINAKVVLIIREEFLAQLTAFEDRIPELFENRARLEKMSWRNAIQAIEGPCSKVGIATENGFAERLLSNIAIGRKDVELTYLQVYLDRVYASMQAEGSSGFTLAQLERIGPVGDVLATFLEEHIAEFPDPERALTVLKAFVSNKGTKRLVTLEEVKRSTEDLGQPVDDETLKENILRAVNLRILKDQDDQGRYELRHDSLAATIYSKISLFEKELIDIRQFIEQAFATFQKRKALLSKEDLLYIAPYEERLFLSKDQRAFVDLSRKMATQRARRRMAWGIGIAGTVITILSILTVWALQQRSAAVFEKQAADSARERAEAATVEAQEATQRVLAMNDSIRILMHRSDSLRDIGQFEAARATTEAANAMSARAQEEKQRILAEERSTVIEQKSKETETALSNEQKANIEKERVNLLNKAGAIALNSLEVKDDPSLRGAMAIQALRFMERHGGDLQDESLVRALRTALLNLELKDPARIPLRTTAKSAAASSSGGLLVLDKDGRTTRINPTERTSVLLGNPPITVSGLDHGTLAADEGLVLWAQKEGGLATWSQNGGSVLHKVPRTDHLDDVSAMACFTDGTTFVSGDRKGRTIIWQAEGSALKIVAQVDLGGIIRGMATLKQTDQVVVVNKTAQVHFLSRSGTVRKVTLPAGEEAQRIAVDGQGTRCFVGTSSGNIYSIDGNGNQALKVGSSSRGIESLTVRGDGKRIAFVNAAKRLTVLDPAAPTRALHMDLEELPSTLMFGPKEELYLVSGLKVERTYCTSKAFADRICVLLQNRTLTPQEWEQRIGIGQLEVPCDR